MTIFYKNLSTINYKIKSHVILIAEHKKKKQIWMHKVCDQSTLPEYASHRWSTLKTQSQEKKVAIPCP